MQPSREIWKIVLIYALFGSAWIILSDKILDFYISGKGCLLSLSIVKGLLFIITTSILLYFLIARSKTKISYSVAALRESEERFHFLVKNSSDCLVIVNADGSQRYVSQGAEKLFGYSRAELEGKNIDDIVHPDDLPAIKAAWEEVVNEREQTVSVQYRHIHKDGGWVYCEAVARSFLHDPTIAGVIASVRDITKRKNSENALQKRNQFISTVLDNLPIGLAVNYIDEGTAIYMNKKFEEIYGWPKEELQDIEEFFTKVYPDEEYREKIRKQVMEDIESGDPNRMSWEGFQVTGKSGRIKIIEAQNIPLFEQGIMISTVQDITERRSLQEQLDQVKKLESIGRLAGGVAHDLNNLLTPILGYSEMLLQDLHRQDPRYDSVDAIYRAGMRARDLVHQLLAFSRKQVLEFRSVDINRIITSLEKLLRLTVTDDIAIKTLLKPEISLCSGDAGQIEQVLMNLATNAADAMPNGGEITIETDEVVLDEAYVATRQGVQPGTYILLAVSDTGCGMNAETAKQVFEPFFTTKGKQGTGLGLATVYGIVKQHKGNIWLYSEVGSGTTFKVYFPISENSAGEEPEKAQRADLRGQETVLIAEDDEQVLRLAEKVLRQQGYTILEAKDGREAITVADSHDGTVHLLLTDVVMPGMNGRELYRKLAQKYPDIKALYMSGYTDNVIAHRGMLDKGIQFIQKPFTNRNLAIKVKEILADD